MNRALFLALVACGAPQTEPEQAPLVPEAAFEAETSVPLTGGTLAISPDGSLAAAADIAGDRVLLIDLASASVAGEVALESGDQPARMVLDDDGVALVALRRGGAVARVDLITGEVSRTPTCPAPRGLTADGDSVWLACASGELVELDAATGAVVNSVFVAHDLRDVVVDGDTLLVSTFKRAELLTLSRTGDLLATRVAAAAADQVGPDPDDDVRFEPGGAWRTLPSPDGGALMIHQRGNSRRIPTPDGSSSYADDSTDPEDPGRRGCGSLVHTAVTWFGPGGAAPQTTAILADTVLPIDGAIAPDGRFAIAASGARDIEGFDAPDWVVFGAEAYAEPLDCIVGEGTRIVDDSQLSSLAFTPQGVAVGVGRSPFRVYVDGAAVALAQVPDPDPEASALRERGFDLFNRDASAGIACSSCHLEGQEDGRTWLFSDVGPRRTQSMAGGLAATAPFHWGGEFTNFGELMQEVLVSRMAHPPIEALDVQALAFFMEGLKPTPVTPMGDAAAIAAGRALFEDPVVGCENCHVGELKTANVNADVGTGRSFQVPSLVGVGIRFPYMHDGCAATLEDRFGPCGGDAHGHTEDLDADQIGALVAYLQTL